MLLYTIIVKPFDKVESNFLNVYNEFIIAFSFFSVLIMNNYELSDFMMKIWGWILTIPVIGSLFISLYFTLPQMLEELKKTITKCFTKKSTNLKNKSKKRKLGLAKTLGKVERSKWYDINYGKSQLN